MPSKDIVPGIASGRGKKAAASSDVKPRTPRTTIQKPPAGIDPARLEEHIQNMEGDHARVLQNEVLSQATTAASRMVGADPTSPAINRELIAAVLQEMGVRPGVIPEPAPETVPAPVHTTGNTGGTTTRAAYVPPLVSQGLVNVLAQLQAMPVETVDARLNDLAAMLYLRDNAQTLEARQRYTLMACVQIVQDFEQLWATPGAPLK